MLNDPQFWVFVAFVLFVLLIFKPVRKILTTNLDEKINNIKISIDEAEILKNETQQALSEINKRQNEVKKEIEIIFQDAKNKIKLIEENANDKLNEQIAKRNENAKNKIDQMTREVNTELKQYITNISISATKTILQKYLRDSEKNNLIEKSIKDISSVLKS